VYSPTTNQLTSDAGIAAAAARSARRAEMLLRHDGVERAGTGEGRPEHREAAPARPRDRHWDYGPQWDYGPHTLALSSKRNAATQANRPPPAKGPATLRRRAGGRSLMIDQAQPVDR
jgi:hypothetical protein